MEGKLILVKVVAYMVASFSNRDVGRVSVNGISNTIVGKEIWIGVPLGDGELCGAIGRFFAEPALSGCNQ